MEHRRTLTISDDHGAHFERHAVIGEASGEQRRVLESKSIPIGDVLPSDLSMCTLLPTGCRFHVTDGITTFFVTEHLPQVRTVQWDAEEDRNNLCIDEDGAGARRRFDPEQRTFALAFPYVVMVHEFNNDQYVDCYCFYRTKPLRSVDDMLYEPNLPNVFGLAWGYTQYSVCFPKEAIRVRGRTLAEKVEDAELVFWGSAFNDEVIDFYEQYKKCSKHLASPWHWEAASRSKRPGPRFMLRVKWRAAMTVHEFIGERGIQLRCAMSGAALAADLLNRAAGVAGGASGTKSATCAAA